MICLDLDIIDKIKKIPKINVSKDYLTIISKENKKKSRIRETKHLWTDAGSSTNAIGGWTKNTPKPDFFEKWKKSSKTQKLKNV